jgi:hypothetical protein
LREISISRFFISKFPHAITFERYQEIPAEKP